MATVPTYEQYSRRPGPTGCAKHRQRAGDRPTQTGGSASVEVWITGISQESIFARRAASTIVAGRSSSDWTRTSNPAICNGSFASVRVTTRPPP
jgi:hypothetical protein